MNALIHFIELLLKLQSFVDFKACSFRSNELRHEKTCHLHT